jgi:MFS family permease
MLDKPDAQFRVGEAAWVVVLMSVCFGFSYLDRNVLTILTQPIKHSLALSDTQIGVLGGFAFSIFIFLGGLPLAWLIDRTNRIRLTAACVFVWSAATIMSGLSTGFAQLLVSRAFTAIAEAALIPAGLSIFADMLPVRRLPLASSVLMIGGFVGGGAALYLGGTFLAHFSAPDASQWFLPQLLPWQRVYLMVGLAGIVPVTLLLLMTREPARREIVDVNKQVNEKAPPIREVFSYLFVESGFYAPFILGVCAISWCFTPSTHGFRHFSFGSLRCLSPRPACTSDRPSSHSGLPARLGHSCSCAGLRPTTSFRGSYYCSVASASFRSETWRCCP